MKEINIVEVFIGCGNEYSHMGSNQSADQTQVKATESQDFTLRFKMKYAAASLSNITITIQLMLNIGRVYGRITDRDIMSKSVFLQVFIYKIYHHIYHFKIIFHDCHSCIIIVYMFDWSSPQKKVE